MRDPYDVLGVSRDATADKIRAAYRKLAKTSHPDLHPGDKAAEDRFKEVSHAYDLLSDPDKRARFDRGEIDANGTERPPFHRGFARGAGRAQPGFGGGFQDSADLEDMIQELFGGRFRGGAGLRMRGADVSFRLELGLEDVAKGGKRQVNLQGGMVDLSIPAGVEDGQVLRLKGKGAPGSAGGPPGDALVEIRVRPHPWFERRGSDIHLALPVTLAEAIKGAKVTVPTLHGPVALTVPKRSSTGTVLRLKGKGLPHGKAHATGDQYVRLEVAIPKAADAELERLIAQWEAAHPYDPREAFKGG